MDREQLERFKRERLRRNPLARRNTREKIGLQRIAFELMHLAEENLTQAEKETIAAAKAERDLMSPEAEAAIHKRFMEEYYGIEIDQGLDELWRIDSDADDRFS